MRLLPTLALTVLVLAATTAPASAAYHASPNGTGTQCIQESPCSITQALQAPSRSEVVVSEGDYLLSEGLSGNRFDMHGVAGRPRPRLVFTADTGFNMAGNEAKLRHLEFQLDQGSVNAFANLIEDVVVTSKGPRPCRFNSFDDLGPAIVRDVVCAGASFPDLSMNATIELEGFAGRAEIRNVTTRHGISVRRYGGNSGGPDRMDAAIVNTIAPRIQGEADGATSTAAIMITTSNVQTTDELEFNGGSVGFTMGAGNQTAPPSFETGSLFRQAPGSVTIDAGTDADANGAADIEGQPRRMNGRTDIGADEFGTAPAAVLTGASGLGATTVTLNGEAGGGHLPTTAQFEYGPTTAYGASAPAGTVPAQAGRSAVSATLAGLAPGTNYHYRLVATNEAGQAVTTDGIFTTPPSPLVVVLPDTTKPSITALSFSPRTFRVASALTALQAATPRGSKLRVGLSEAATVTLVFERASKGRRKGSRCVAGRRTGKKCTRYVKVVSLTRRLAKGTSSVAISGRFGTKQLSKKLAAGSYRLSATAVDAAGNRSAARRTTFKTVSPSASR